MAVVSEGGFSRAADALHMAQPPLSRQIQQLEDQLGVPLLDRRSRPLQPTVVGRFFFERALYVLDQVEALITMTKRLSQLGRGRFRIGFVGSTLYGELPSVVRRFRASYPEITVELQELTSIEQVSALKEGHIDVGFGRLFLDDQAVKREVLRDEPLAVAIPIGHHLLDRVSSLHMEHLADEPLIVYPKEPRPSYADQVLSLYRSRGLEPHAVHEASGLQAALGFVAAAQGICLVPESVKRQRREDVIYRNLDEAGATSPIIMFSRVHEPSRETVSILEYIREMYSQAKRG